jgi:hypothetical protein
LEHPLVGLNIVHHLTKNIDLTSSSEFKSVREKVDKHLLNPVWITDDLVSEQLQIVHVDVNCDALRVGLELEDLDYFFDYLFSIKDLKDFLEGIGSDP